MNQLELVLFWLEIIGVLAFSISGAMAAIEEKLDYFGVIFLGTITALGGGVLRDTLLGNLPPANFNNYHCIIISVVAATAVFLIAYITRDYYFSHMHLIEQINNCIDAVGLGVFTISGIQVAIETKFGYNVFLLVFMGMITGVGGGLLRDIIVGRKPLIFSKHIYALASIAGGVFYLICIYAGVKENLSLIISIVIIFAIRMLSAHFKWNLPRIS
ncbi:MAG: trimeric intracellular cation channel family protein [Hespellia sp.]|nr:trimeric intracellular cation channel family protein [Hespellia sp.]